MFQRRILPAEEELWDTVMLTGFAAVWYGSLLRTFLNGGTNGMNAVIFLLGGLLPLYAAFVRSRAALSCRKKRREAIATGRCCRGVIRHVIVETIPYRGRHGRIHYQKRYYLLIDRMEEGSAFGMEVKTGAYRVPVHIYLKSREVKLYSDASGWNWYAEELQCGRFRQKPVLVETDRADGEIYVGDVLFRIVFLAVLLLIFLQGIL